MWSKNLSSQLELYKARFFFKWRTFVDFFRTAFRYYDNPLFRRVDLALLCAYSLKNPYQISRRYLEREGASEIYAYGETPLATMEKIAKACAFKEGDRLYELGCGRGRACFWLALYLKLDVIGIDFVPEFIEKAEAIKRHFSLKNPKFRLENFLDTSFEEASFLYLHGTCMEDPEIEALIQKLNALKRGVQVITVSFALNEYPLGKRWKVEKSFSASFSWGDAEVYLQNAIDQD